MDDRKPPSDLFDWMGIKGAPDWRVARVLGPGVAVFIALLIAGAYVAAFAIVYRVLFGGGAASLGTGALIAALLGAPFVIWGTVLKHQTLRDQKEGRTIERIKKAVEQLGVEKTVKKIVNDETQETSEPNIEVRIGAILSLERIAQDSTMHDNGRDHVRVMEILCAYVRENAPAKEAEDFPFPQGSGQGTLEAKRTVGLGWLTNEFTARPDVQIAISVIGRRTPQQVAVEKTTHHMMERDIVSIYQERICAMRIWNTSTLRERLFFAVKCSVYSAEVPTLQVPILSIANSRAQDQEMPISRAQNLILRISRMLHWKTQFYWIAQYHTRILSEPI